VTPAYFDRQERVGGWRQDAFRRARVLVAERGWGASFAVWGLAGLGIGEILWVGSEQAQTATFDGFLTAQHAPSLGICLLPYPFHPESPAELDWILSGHTISAVIGTGKMGSLLQAATGMHGIPYLQAPFEEAPARAMIAAALLVDEFRQLVNPLPAVADREHGPCQLPAAGPRRPERVMLVGTGGIGVCCAAALAASRVPLVLIDLDHVEITNLNRQGLFTPQDAELARPKAIAAAERLRSLFPGVEISALVAEVDEHSAPLIASCAPDVIVSAVDNAAARLALSEIGVCLSVPVVQAGTDIFSADCYTQLPGGPLLDEQMMGALSRAVETESGARSGRCSANPSYVVPGMIAGGFAAYRALDVASRRQPVTSLHWRSGVLPRARKEFRDEFAAAHF